MVLYLKKQHNYNTIYTIKHTADIINLYQTLKRSIDHLEKAFKLCLKRVTSRHKNGKHRSFVSKIIVSSYEDAACSVAPGLHIKWPNGRKIDFLPNSKTQL